MGAWALPSLWRHKMEDEVKTQKEDGVCRPGTDVSRVALRRTSPAKAITISDIQTGEDELLLCELPACGLLWQR